MDSPRLGERSTLLIAGGAIQGALILFLVVVQVVLGTPGWGGVALSPDPRHAMLFWLFLTPSVIAVMGGWALHLKLGQPGGGESTLPQLLKMKSYNIAALGLNEFPGVLGLAYCFISGTAFPGSFLILASFFLVGILNIRLFLLYSNEPRLAPPSGLGNQ